MTSQQCEQEIKERWKCEIEYTEQKASLTELYSVDLFGNDFEHVCVCMCWHNEEMGLKSKDKLRRDESDHHEQPEEHWGFLTRRVFNLDLFNDWVVAVKNTSYRAGIILQMSD